MALCRAWKEELDRAMATEGKVWVERKRFDSFAPPRQNCTAKWYVHTCMHILLVHMHIHTHTHTHTHTK